MTAPLPAGYRLRRATAQDAERIAAFNLANLTWADGSPDVGVGDLTRDLFDRHPSFKPNLYTVVEDAAGEIASAMCLIPQTFSYDTVAVPTGQPELVATRPADRRKGLVRAQFELIHEMATERQVELLVIPGIPGFYTQFGYELAVPRNGGWVVDAPARPAAGIRLRPAGDSDVALLEVLYRQSVRRHLLACPRDAALWRYELSGHRAACTIRLTVRLIEAGGAVVGFVASLPAADGSVRIRQLELGAGGAWPVHVPEVLAALGAEAAATAPPGATPTLALELGPEHPAYAFHGRPLTSWLRPRAWAVRVPDEPAFLRRIAPSLEVRLAHSALAQHSGTLVLGDYRTGLRLTFERGRLADVDRIDVTTEAPGDVSLPGLLRWHLLFGHRSLADLEAVLPDVLVHRPAARPLVDALFPRRVSNPWALN